MTVTKTGQCPCGSSLFYEPLAGDDVSVTAGALEAPTGVTLAVPIFTEDKGDDYDLDKRISIRPKS